MHFVAERRKKAFKRNKKALISWRVFLLIFVISLFAPFICNDKPILIWDSHQIYFPQFEFVSDKMMGGELPTRADFSDPFTKEYLQQILLERDPRIKYLDFFRPQPLLLYFSQ